MVFKGSKKKAEAATFLMFLLFDPEAQKVAAEEAVGIPLLHSMNTFKAYLESMPAGAAHWGDTLDRFISYERCAKNQDRLWTTLQTVVTSSRQTRRGSPR